MRKRIRCKRHLRMRVAVTLIMILLTCGAMAAPPGLAQDVPPPTIADGEWQGVMVSSSQFGASGASGLADFSGQMRFTSSGGTLEGSWSLTGSGDIRADEGSGTAVYRATGDVGGTSSSIQFVAVGVTIDMVITLSDGSSFENSVTVPPEESGIVPTLTYATCSQVVGTWHVEAEGLTGGGTLVLVRVSDLRPEDEPDYLTQVTDLLTDTYAFTASVESSSGPADLSGLYDLVGRAESLYDALVRNADCGLSEDTVEHLLDFALSNPDMFGLFELNQLATTAVRTGLPIGESWDGYQARLSAELASRLEDAVDSGNTLDMEIIVATAVTIGDWDLAAEAEAAAREAE
jgi:hypothetical protein